MKFWSRNTGIVFIFCNFDRLLKHFILYKNLKGFLSKQLTMLTEKKKRDSQFDPNTLNLTLNKYECGRTDNLR